MKPEELLDPANLPDDLQWIATHYRLQPNDPVFLLIAWHWSGGRTSSNWQPIDEPWFKTTAFQALPEGKAVIRHPRRRGRPLLRRLPFTNFTLANSSVLEEPDRN